MEEDSVMIKILKVQTAFSLWMLRIILYVIHMIKHLSCPIMDKIVKNIKNLFLTYKTSGRRELRDSKRLQS